MTRKIRPLDFNKVDSVARGNFVMKRQMIKIDKCSHLSNKRGGTVIDFLDFFSTLHSTPRLLQLCTGGPRLVRFFGP